MLQIGWRVRKGTFRRVVHVFGIRIYEQVLDPRGQIHAMDDYKEWVSLYGQPGEGE